ncbi:MAG: (2Fe-2S)-binding protein [Alteromonadaceae bacterium]|nr:(2Fe-2S)-binding protein [Alteromonadaceae bacterium]
MFFKQCHLHINHICKLAKGLSERLSADLIAKALLQVSPLSNKNELNQALMHWQDALFIQQYSQYQFKQNNPQLQRATCCLHYKVDASAYCKTCPKLKANRIKL